MDDSIEDINSILHAMEDLARPYQRALEQLDSIPGIDISSALAILAEISANPQKSFISVAHISSWAGLSPRNDERAGKVKSRKVLHGNPYIKSVL